MEPARRRTRGPFDRDRGVPLERGVRVDDPVVDRQAVIVVNQLVDGETPSLMEAKRPRNRSSLSWSASCARFGIALLRISHSPV